MSITGKERGGDEERLHAGVVEYLRLMGADKRCIWFHPNNGGFKLGRAAAGKAKARGVLAGVPDLVFTLDDGNTAFMEFKGPKGRLSEAQEAFRLKCITMGVPYVVIQDFDQAVAVLDGWGVLRKRSAAA